MFGFPHRSTRAALLVETEENGEKKVLIYQMGMPISVSIEQEYNTFDFAFADGASRIRPRSTRVQIEGYLEDPRVYGHEFPTEQPEIEPTHLAIESNEGEIIIDEEGFEEWQRDD